MTQIKQANNTGALFTNRNRTEARHPDFVGKVMCEDKEYYISAWKKKGKSGNWLSLALREFVPRESEYNGNRIDENDSLKW